MKQIEKNTHIIDFKKDGEGFKRQGAIGKTDLLNILREMMKDGFTEFHITTKQNDKK